MTGRKGEALDENEAVSALDAAGEAADRADVGQYWHAFLAALNDQDVVLVWDGPAEVAKPDTERLRFAAEVLMQRMNKSRIELGLHVQEAADYIDGVNR